MHHSFRDMDVWKKANGLSIEVFNLSNNLPKAEDYALTSQIRKSSNSVSANIAEAFGRKFKKDKSNLYVISRASAYETQNHLIYGRGVGYFTKEEIDPLLEGYDELAKDLNKIMKSLN